MELGLLNNLSVTKPYRYCRGLKKYRGICNLSWTTGLRESFTFSAPPRFLPFSAPQAKILRILDGQALGPKRPKNQDQKIKPRQDQDKHPKTKTKTEKNPRKVLVQDQDQESQTSLAFRNLFFMSILIHI
uniref:Uncharacterized protein n=1 Tax=Meloidogyne enterolobii TaxID=390850 RepID=A0A6V7VXC8_MELEN|nr:unnamed protein product [Meloidogyne enterolobii]